MVGHGGKRGFYKGFPHVFDGGNVREYKEAVKQLKKQHDAENDGNGTKKTTLLRLFLFLGRSFGMILDADRLLSPN